MEVYCVFRNTDNGPQLYNIFENKTVAQEYATLMNNSTGTEDFYMDEWEMIL